MKRFTQAPAITIATIALFLSLGGASLAASRYIITSSNQIKPSVLKSLRGSAGPQGTAGPAGPAGPAGLSGPAGPQGKAGNNATAALAGAYYSTSTVNNVTGAQTIEARCSTADTAISGGVSVSDPTKTVPVGQSFPGHLDADGVLVPGELDGWIVQFASQTIANPGKVTVWALCVPDLSIPVLHDVGDV